jgi:two-component system sensor histidine kinase PilS (NtrC family)
MQEPASTLERHLFWYVVLRLLVAATMVLVSVLLWLTPGGEEFQTSQSLQGFFFRLLGLTSAATLAFFALRKPLRSRPQAQAYLQFVADLVTISLLVYLSGGPTSPFATFYLVIIIVASALMSRRDGVLIATVAYLLYGGLVFALAFGWLLPRGGGVYDPNSARFIYSLLVPLVGFFGVAQLTALLVGNKEQIQRELEARTTDLAALQVVHRDVIESIPSGICTTDLDGTVITINRAGLEILDQRAAEVQGVPIQSVLFTREQWGEFTAVCAEQGRVRSEVTLARNEATDYIGFTLSPLTDGSRQHRGYIVIFQDLTAWRKLEDEVRLKDRMAAVGSLAAGLAHEIGNPLAAIYGSVQMLASRGNGKDDKLLSILLKESQRLDRTIKGFLRFARPRDRSSARFDVGELLRENVELLRNSPEVHAHHSISLSLAPANHQLVGDPDQITQIFWNLARNALKAMPAGGSLEIEGVLAETCYAMRFRDTGKGMTEQERANLFHPFQSFFDTGTGIGMAIVYRIVQEHGGELSVDSEPGAGCTITVKLPTINDLVAAAMESAS